MVKKLAPCVVVALLLLPLLFINIKNSHDWGDDFAQYIHQARNILIGESQNNTGYVYNENYFVGPKAYPAGFPLLMAGFSRCGNDSLKGLNRLISLCWALGCFVGFLFLRKRFSYITALATTLIIAYNPMMVTYKTEVLSDLPFTFFSLLSLYLIDKKENWWLSIILGVLMAYTAHIRSIGLILVFVLIAYRLFHLRKTTAENPFRFLIISLSSFVVVYFGIKLIFPCETNYPDLFTSDSVWINLNKQTSYNIDWLDNFLDSYEIKNFYYISVVASSALIAFGFIGLIKLWKTERTSPVFMYTIAYIFVIIAFPYGDAGLRFLFPLLPLIFLFAIEGMKISFSALNMRGSRLAVVFGGLILFSYHEQIEKILDNTKTIYKGPQKPSAQKMFEYINRNLDAGKVVEFDKPRALALYTPMRSVAINPQQENLDIKKEVVKFDIDYILTNDNLTDNVIRNFANSDTSYCKKIFEVDEFHLYKLNP
jgi:hypothetical protein